MTLNNQFTAAEVAPLLDDVTDLVAAASAVVLAARAGVLDVRTKADLTPVTAADEAAEDVILEGLARLLPGVPVISEERIAKVPLVQRGDCIVLVDPVDGTRELIAGRDEFTVNVAIVAAGAAVLGIVAAPALGLLWRGVAGRGAERMRFTPGVPAASTRREPISARSLPADGIIAAVSRSHLDTETVAFLGRLPQMDRLVSGSAIKLCRVAEGTADVYPRLAATREWDVAAGHAIVAAAGGMVTRPDGGLLTYGHFVEGFLVPGFIAWGDPAAPARLGLFRAPK